MPVRTPARATARRTCSVTSCNARPRALTSISSWCTFTEPSLAAVWLGAASRRQTGSARLRAHLAVRSGALRLAQRIDHRVAERLQIVGLAARDPVLIDHDLLVLHVRSRLLQVALHRRPRGQRAAAHQTRAEQQLRSMAHRGQRPLQRVEPLHEIDEPLVGAQMVRRLAAGDEQPDVILGTDLVDPLVCFDGLLALVALQLLPGLGADDVDLVALLAQPVIRNAELGILEPRAKQTGKFPLCHLEPPSLPTDAHRRQPVRVVRRADGRALRGATRVTMLSRMAHKLPMIEVGFHVFPEGGDEEVGAVREVAPGGRPELLVDIENAGDFVVPLDAVTAVLEEKVIVDVTKLPDRLQNAIKHAHDAEDFP